METNQITKNYGFVEVTDYVGDSYYINRSNIAYLKVTKNPPVFKIVLRAPDKHIIVDELTLKKVANNI